MENNVIRFMTREEFDAMNQTLSELNGGKKLSKADLRAQMVDAFHEAFEMIGGVNRLAFWAHSNPTEFYKIYGKMLPSGATIDLNASGEIVFKHVLPPSKLDQIEEPSSG